MPLPAAVAAALETAGLLTAVTGSLADQVSVAFTIADHIKAQEGLKYNAHVFSIVPPQESASATEPPPASAGSRRQKNKEPASAATAPTAKRDPTRLIAVGGHAILELKSSGAGALFGLNRYLHYNSTGPPVSVFAVHLWQVKGFATEITDQAEIDFSGKEVEAGYLLSIKGFINEFLRGFFHFYCDLLVRHLPATAPSDAQSIVPLSNSLAGRGGSIATTKTGFVVSF
jgi:hypothetical protein